MIDKPKEERWYQLWWVQLIFFPLLVGTILEASKEVPIIRPIYNFILTLYNWQLQIRVSWLLLAIVVISGLMYAVLKKKKPNSKSIQEHEKTKIKLEEVSNEFEKALQQHEVINKEYGFILKEFAAASSKVQELEKYIKNLNQDNANYIKGLNTELHDKKLQLENSNNRLSELKAEYDKTVKEYLQLGIKHKELKDIARTDFNELMEVSKKLDLANTQLKQVTEDHEAAKTELNELKNKYEATIKTQNKLEQDIIAITTKLDEANKRVEEFEREKLARENPPEPEYYNYTKDRFWLWIWKWKWFYNKESNEWLVVGLTPYCPVCEVELINQSNYPYQLAICPKCKERFGYRTGAWDTEDSLDSEDPKHVCPMITYKVENKTYKLDK